MGLKVCRQLNSSGGAVSVIDRQRTVRLSPVRIACFAEFALARLKCPGARLTIQLASDRTIRALNRKWLGEDRAANVIVLPPRRAGKGSPGRELRGDIVISAETALRHAQGTRCCVAAEIDRLVLHGLLHLLGFEHDGDPAAARAMRRREQAIIKSWLV
jgi:probable rRNA maturation factor